MIQLDVLGGLDARADGGRDIGPLLRQPKRAALLAYLATAAPLGRFHRRDRLLAMFWPESDEAHARGALNAAVRFLRRTLGGEVIVSRGLEEIALNPAFLRTDVDAFVIAMEAERHEAALGVYAGDLLDGFHLSDAPMFEEWLEGERSALRGRALRAATVMVDRAQAAGSMTAAVRWAQRAAGLAPDDERGTRRLIEMLESAGDRIGALRTYEQLVQRLRDDFEVEPAAETRALVARIQSIQSSRSDRAGDDSTRTTAARGISHGAGVETALPGAQPDHAHADSGSARAEPIRAGAAARRRATIGLAFVAAVGGVAVAMSRSGADELPRSAGADSSLTVVAVFPFDIEGPPESHYLAPGVRTLLAHALDGAGTLRLVDHHALRNGMPGKVDRAPTLDEAERIARQIGADRIVLGIVTEIDARLTLAATVFKVGAPGAPLARARVEGSREGLSALVTTLARELLAGQRLGPGVRLADISSIGTTNFPALKAYLQGEDVLNRGAYDSAGRAFARAAAHDSTFALAWYGLARARQFVGPQSEQLAAVAAALRYADGLPRRDRLLIEALHAHYHGDGATASDRARTAVGLAPDHAEAWALLGMADGWYGWQRGRNRLDAVAAIERAHALDPKMASILHQLANRKLRLRRWDEADSLAHLAYTQRRGLVNIAASVRTAIAVGRRDSVAVQALLKELGNADTYTTWNAAAYVAMYTDDLAAAERFAWVLTDSARRSAGARASGHLLISLTRLAGGRRRVAEESFTELARLAPELALAYRVWFSVLPDLAVSDSAVRALRAEVQSWPAPTDIAPVDARWFEMPWTLAPQLRRYWLGLMAARLGEGAEALRHAAALERESVPADSIQLLADLALEIRALVAIGDGQHARALQHLERATLRLKRQYDVSTPINLRPLGRYLRARLLEEMGRDGEALGWYSGFAQFVGPEHVFLAPAYLHMATIHERAGRRREAGEYYERFLARWSAPDVELQPLIVHAQEGLQRVKGDPRR